MPIAVGTESDESATRAAFDEWLRTQHGLHAAPDADLEERAYYLAGEAPKLRSTQTWPHWYGMRYVVGPAAGNWSYYWPGCNPCLQNGNCYQVTDATLDALATIPYPGLANAVNVGIAVAWRGGQPYLAVVWPGMCLTPQPMPTFSDPGPTGPGW